MASACSAKPVAVSVLPTAALHAPVALAHAPVALAHAPVAVKTDYDAHPQYSFGYSVKVRFVFLNNLPLEISVVLEIKICYRLNK